MIVQAARIAVASGHTSTADHVFAGSKNEAIHVLQGTRQDLEDMVRDAGAAVKKYAFRHYKLSPYEDTTRAQVLELAADIAAEFGFDVARCVLVEHEKARADDQACGRHWHLLAPEWDPVRRRVLDASWMRPRQEKLGRLAELRMGHAGVKGRWNTAVERQLRAEGMHAEADALAPLAQGDRPEAAFTGIRHQAAARSGLSLPQARLAVAEAWRRGDTAAARMAAVRDLGLQVRPGDKPGIWVVETAGEAPVLLGALHRLVKEPRATVAAIMEERGHGRQQEVELQPGGRPPGPGRGGRGRRDARDGQARTDPAQLRGAADGGDGRCHPGRHPEAAGASARRRGPDGAAAGCARSGSGEAGPHRAEGGCVGSRLEEGRAARIFACAGPGADLRLRQLTERARDRPTRRDPLPPDVAVTLPGHRAVWLVRDPQEDAQARLARRTRWLAAAMRSAYGLEWVPERLVANLDFVHVDRERRAVILVLRSGTRLVDSLDRIDVVGTADDIAVAELVEAVRRRGWGRVRLHGPPEFRHAAALRLQALEPPIAVADNPLTEVDPERIASLVSHSVPPITRP